MTTLETLEKYILPKLRVRLSTFDTVNDPFELLGAQQIGRRNRRNFADLYRHWASTFGFVSFTDNWKSPLMWAHYAANHTGVCLGIEIPGNRVWQVNYQPERLEKLLKIPFFEAAIDEELFRQAATTKFEEWAYEREWRYIEELDHKDTETGLRYVDFSPGFELREIIAGARCKRKLRKIRDQVFGNTDEINVFQVRASFGTFGMVRQKLHEVLKIDSLHKVEGMSTRRRSE